MWRTLVKENRFTIVHSYTDINRAFDASYGEIIIPSLEDGEYLQFFQDVNTAVNVGPFVVSIFMDASGQTYAQDSIGGDINLRTVTTTSYTYPYIDGDGIWHYVTFTFTFENGSTFSNIDINNSAYWYFIQGVSDMNNLLQWT